MFVLECLLLIAIFFYFPSVATSSIYTTGVKLDHGQVKTSMLDKIGCYIPVWQNCVLYKVFNRNYGWTAFAAVTIILGIIIGSVSTAIAWVTNASFLPIATLILLISVLLLHVFYAATYMVIGVLCNQNLFVLIATLIIPELMAFHYRDSIPAVMRATED